MLNMLKMKDWRAVGFNWEVVRESYHAWYYLLRDGKVIKESNDFQELLKLGWY